jgi:ABC-type polysaccharide/polyol phosphate export permease
MFEFARYINITKLTFAAIDVSMKAIEKMGFNITEIGYANKEVIPEQERANYARWFSTYNPVLCMLDTKQAPLLSKKVFDKFDDKAILSGKLAKEINFQRKKFL